MKLNSTSPGVFAVSCVALVALALSSVAIVQSAEPEFPRENSGNLAGRFVDAHVHFHDTKPGELEKVAAWMASNNVQRVINHPLRQSRAKDDKERAQQKENYKAFNGRMARFCIIFPDEVNSVDEAVVILNREKQAGAVGFGEHYGEVSKPQPGDKGLYFDDPKNRVLFAACAQVGLPVMFHYNDKTRNMDEKGMPRLQNVLKLYPNCILIAHGDWWRSITDGACGRLLETYPNLYADISCTVGRSPVGRDKHRWRAISSSGTPTNCFLAPTAAGGRSARIRSPRRNLRSLMS
jgi:predicted TIM-barrel fold metal-dependent hydrolase